MQAETRRYALASLFAAALLSLATVASAVNYNPANGLTGTVISVNRDLNYITVRDDVTGQNFKIDVRDMDTRRSLDVWNLRAGDRVTATGSWENNETWRALRVMQASPMALNRLANGITGTVENVNRDLKYITVRDQSSGAPVRIDVRNMDTRRSVNVWDLRTGDLVTAHGTWAKNNSRFRADFVNFTGNVPMSSGGYNPNTPNVLTGTVVSVKRDLNYFTLRDDATGQQVKIDVRNMDTRRSPNVWKLRAGDRITVDGIWSGNRDRFQADMVRF